MADNINIVLFYPRLGWMDTFVVDLPLSLVFVAYECRRQGVEVRIVDQRIAGRSWQSALEGAIDSSTVLVGFSCMTGNPILNALEATRLVKKNYPGLPTVWGGHHVTICPNEAVLEPAIDFIIRGHGSGALWDLVRLLRGEDVRREDVAGLGWLEEGQVRLNPMSREPDFAPLAELSLEGLDLKKYTRFNYREQVYSLFTSFGCPHQCKFCFAPIFYRQMKGARWFPYPAQDVVDHILQVARENKIGYLSLLDENFFLDLKRARFILEGVLAQGVRPIWGIRGARVDDLDRMDPDFMDLMSRAGVRQIMIGAESGSPRMLKAMKKGITVEQTISANRKLARFPNLFPSYNFLSGLPGETVEDMNLSVDLIMQLLADNPNASFSGMNQFMPFPGSDLYEQCRQAGFKEPQTLEGWAFVDTHYSQSKVPWVGEKEQKTLNAIQAALMFVDDKAGRELDHKGEANKGGQGSGGGAAVTRGPGMRLIFGLIVILSRLYRPVALWRLRRKFFKFPVEYYMIRLASRALAFISGQRRGNVESKGG